MQAEQECAFTRSGPGPRLTQIRPGLRANPRSRGQTNDQPSRADHPMPTGFASNAYWICLHKSPPKQAKGGGFGLV